MAQEQLQAFIENVDQMAVQHELLKKYSLTLEKDNKILKQENKHLSAQHNEAKLTLQQIMQQLKGLQA